MGFYCGLRSPFALHTRTPLLSEALASVSFGFVFGRIRVIRLAACSAPLVYVSDEEALCINMRLVAQTFTALHRIKHGAAPILETVAALFPSG